MSTTKRRTCEVLGWFATLRTASHDFVARCMMRTFDAFNPEILIHQGRILLIAAAAMWVALYAP